MPYDEGLLERCLDALRALGPGAIRHKNVFSMRGLMRGSKMFAAVGEDRIIVRLTRDELNAALQRPGVRPFAPGGSALGTWGEVDGDLVAEDPELRDWLEAGLRSLA